MCSSSGSITSELMRSFQGTCFMAKYSVYSLKAMSSVVLIF